MNIRFPVGICAKYTFLMHFKLEKHGQKKIFWPHKRINLPREVEENSQVFWGIAEKSRFKSVYSTGWSAWIENIRLIIIGKNVSIDGICFDFTCIRIRMYRLIELMELNDWRGTAENFIPIRKLNRTPKQAILSSWNYQNVIGWQNAQPFLQEEIHRNGICLLFKKIPSFL